MTRATYPLRAARAARTAIVTMLHAGKRFAVSAA